MKELFSDFQSPSKQDWIDKIKTDLKGKDFNTSMLNTYGIEELEIWSQHHRSNSNTDQQTPGSGSFKRGNRTENNDWEIVATLPVSEPKAMNRFALDFLMKGNTALEINFSDFSLADCKTIIHGIDFNYITTAIHIHTSEQLKFIQELFKSFPNARIDVFSDKIDIKEVKGRSTLIKAIDVLNYGGNSIQEIAFALHAGHTKLHKLLQKGISVDEASFELKFTFGIGNLYFVEIAKFRAFRSLWSFIVEQYKPKEECSKTAYIQAQSIFVNKSLKDPYTNLLRLTTEALSTAVGGVNEINLLPYDLFADKKNTSLTQRMSNNISLLLKEEAYMNQVIDVSGGAYAIEKLTATIQEKAWNLFQQLEKDGIEPLKHQINQKRKERISFVENGNQILIGVNKYPNIQTEENSWTATPKTEFGEYLILERDSKTELA